MKNLSPVSILFLSCFFLSLLTSCHYYKLERKLNPGDADWLNKVRYIITKDENRMFLDIPEAEKEQFKEEFWKRRDPDPETEENEFQMEYYDRIERATELFLSEGRPGWLTDRGRIYILFGPPMDRITNPMGSSSYGRCSEIWYYGNFPIVFVDSTCTGDYRLITINLEHMHELNLAEQRAQQTTREDVRFFNFDWSVRKTLVESGRIEAKVFMEIPYSNIWFKEEDDKLVTTLELSLELRDSEGKLVWEYLDTFRVETDEEELKGDKKKKFEVEVPFVLESDLEGLRQGTNKIFAILKNTTGGDEQKKVLEFNIN